MKMKKIYKKPAAGVINVNLLGSVLDEPNPGVGNYSQTTDYGDAKKNSLGLEEDDALANPTQPNLWGDEDD